MTLRRIICLSLTVLSSLVFVYAFTLANGYFSDVPDNPLYTPHIESLYNAHFVTGDTVMGVPSGTFRPDDTINRAEFTKITTIIRLAELYGVNENWNGKPELEILEKVNDKLQYFYKCDNTDTLGCSLKKGADITNVCNVCTSIGGTPFSDVSEKEWGCEEEDICDPWFTQYIYYAVAKGFIKGYPDKTFKPYNQILRIHALKMILSDNGTTDDARFQSLESLADSRGSSSPRCLFGADKYILDNNAGDTDLLSFALLADRLGLFGNDCSVFGNSTTPIKRADFLQKSLTRKEAARYYALTTSYYPISANPESVPEEDAAEVKEDVKIITETDTKTVDETAEPKTETSVKTQESSVPQNSLTSATLSSASVIALYDEYGASCGTIPANKEFGVLVVRVGTDGKFYQYTDFDQYRTCRFPCDKLMTPACREAISMSAVATGEGVQTEVVAMNVSDFFPISSLKAFMPKEVADTINVITNPKPESIFPGGVDYWYTVIPGWETKSDGLWGGIFSKRIYSKAYLIDTLFPQKSGDRYKELVVKAKDGVGLYDESEPNASSNKKAMITNYRTDRWYQIVYTDPNNPNEGIKVGWVPVSGLILKDSSLFSVGSNGYYELANGDDYQSNPDCLGAYSKGTVPIDKILLHNSNGSSVMGLKSGCAVHYYLAREDAKYGNKFVIRVPEYLNSASAGLGDSERRAISVEMVNWEWANPAFDPVDKKTRIVKNNIFHNFDFKKIESYKINNKDENTHIFTTIQNFINDQNIEYRDYDLVNYYFNESSGFFEAFNIPDVNLPHVKNKNSKEKDVKDQVRGYKKVFDEFYTIPTGKNYYKLKPQYQFIIDSGSDPNNKLQPLYEVLNNIPFGYTFYQSKGGSLDYTRVIDPNGTFPRQVYLLPDNKVSQPMNDEKDADYYEKYTAGQYSNLDKFIRHMNSKYGIPTKTFENNLSGNIPIKYGFYSFSTAANWSDFGKKVTDFKGIISHRISTSNGKMCPAPGFQIDRIPVLTY